MLEVYAGNDYPLLSCIILCFISVNQCSCPPLAHRDSTVKSVSELTGCCTRTNKANRRQTCGPSVPFGVRFYALDWANKYTFLIKNILKICLRVSNIDLRHFVAVAPSQHGCDTLWGSFCCLVEENRRLMCSRRGLCGPVVVSWQITKPRKKKKKRKEKKKLPPMPH